MNHCGRPLGGAATDSSAAALADCDIFHLSDARDDFGRSRNRKSAAGLGRIRVV